jgi:hypothetical protein
VSAHSWKQSGRFAATGSLVYAVRKEKPFQGFGGVEKTSFLGSQDCRTTLSHCLFRGPGGQCYRGVYRGHTANCLVACFSWLQLCSDDAVHKMTEKPMDNQVGCTHHHKLVRPAGRPVISATWLSLVAQDYICRLRNMLVGPAFPGFWWAKQCRILRKQD